MTEYIKDNKGNFFGVSLCKVDAQSSLKIKESDWLTTGEAAAYLKVAIGTLKNWTSNGKIPFHKLNRLNRYSKRELDELLLGQKRGVS